MSDITFNNPQLLWLSLIVVPIIVWYIFKERTIHADMTFSSLSILKQIKRRGNPWLRHILFAMRMLAILLLIVALARPQHSNTWEEYSSEGIDIVLAVDISSSMLARDFEPDRLEAAKEVAAKFVNARNHDRIGLVVFSGESFTQCPLTTDHAVVVNLINELKSGMIEDGTAIGLGLANAVNRLKDSQAKSKVIILLTDGVNNRGSIAPQTAAELAKTFGIKVYTIGVGKYGNAPYPVQTPFGIQIQQMPVEIDEPSLIAIAELTGGRYFRADDNNKLERIYEEIDKLEKDEIEVKHFSKKEELFFPFALAALLMLLTEALLRYSLLRRIP
ncbi:MAG: VWA domain-containing protein [Marinifilaceae bacterium]|nr:VWA domain-containing protein [Marinifilaceae bacterium]